jgi:hypothetical protein
MPSPSRSNLTMPTAAESSLSHWSTVLPSILPHSTGTTCHSGRSAITIPAGVDPEVAGNPSRRQQMS